MIISAGIRLVTLMVVFYLIEGVVGQIGLHRLIHLAIESKGWNGTSTFKSTTGKAKCAKWILRAV